MDCTHLIERLEAFEERMGVRLEALFADWDKNYTPPTSYVKLRGELYPREGNIIEQRISVVVDVYDAAGRLVGHSDNSFDPEKFFGFETFESYNRFEVPKLKISKIRVYPKPG